MRFYVGQPVVCVHDDFTRVKAMYPNCSWPVHGVVYHVRRYLLAKPTLVEGALVVYPAIALYEIHNPMVTYMDGIKREAGFWDERFEPVTKALVGNLIAEAISGGGKKDVKKKQKEDA
jgi:hypothetical protein